MGFPTLNYTPGSTIFHFCDLGAAICQNVWMDVLCFFLKLEIIFIYFYNEIYNKKNINYKINIFFFYNLNIYNNKYIYLKK